MLLSTLEVADMFGVKCRTIFRWVQQGMPVAFRSGSGNLYMRAEVITWATERGFWDELVHMPIHRGKVRSSATHCGYGHEKTSANFGRDNRGHKYCRVCRRGYEERNRAKKRELRLVVPPDVGYPITNVRLRIEVPS